MLNSISFKFAVLLVSISSKHFFDEAQNISAAYALKFTQIKLPILI